MARGVVTVNELVKESAPVCWHKPTLCICLTFLVGGMFPKSSLNDPDLFSYIL